MDSISPNSPSPRLHNDTSSSIPSAVFLGIRISLASREAITSIVRTWIQEGTRGWLGYVNIHILNLHFGNPIVRKYYENALLNYCDGEGVRRAMKLLRLPLPERMGLTYWIEDLLALAAGEGFPVFFLGGSDELIERTMARAREKFPGLRIAGGHHGYFSEDDSSAVIRTIAESGAKLVFVAMGSPKQETWIVRNFQALPACIVLNGGSCFDVFAGVRKRPPEWIADAGLEWLFRLLQNPRRLWKRYLIGIPAFAVRLLRAGMSNRRRTHSGEEYGR